MMENSGQAFDVSLLKRLIAFAKPYKGIFIISLLSAILLSFFGVARPMLMQTAVDRYIVTKDLDGLMFFAMLMFGALIMEVLCQFSFILFSNMLGQDVIKDIRIKLFSKLLSFKMQYFDKASVGRLVTRSVSDVETIASIFSEGLFSIFSDLLKMAVVLGVMFYKSWDLTLIVLSIMPFVLYATRVFQKAMKKAFNEVRNQVANLNSFVQERITGMHIVQLFGREKIEYDNFIKINKEHQNAWLKTVWYNSIFFPIAELSSSITIGLIAWYGGLNAVVGDKVTLGMIFLFIELSQMLFRPLRQIADKFNTLQMGMVAANRVFGILDTEAHIQDAGKDVIRDFKGNISFKNVRFSYLPGEVILKNLSFDVKAGETVAIVGATGAGKSTIINLLGRFYEIDGGSICLDNVDIRSIQLADLRKKIAVVLQDVFLFADTIFNNITLNKPEVTIEEVVAAAKQIGLHEFFSSLPDGYNYNVKERGAMLSAGQRQLIAFLRAYITNPGILVLDEATSSIDSYSEQLLQDATKKITKGRTSIIIAHRLATIKKADRILVMDKGELVETGTHKELLKKENGYYRKLYDMQFAVEVVIED
ncbi:MAG: antibiotic ABC transporter ATP-binding protein [Flavobacteriales bacterium CG_4_9_14_3_um_filter_40_17]|nr:MAG: antibiotic ABC transporter ATP-binding protein [Flavobacteriales bacterium CG_4_9_14_3_um_filter_40_17]